MSAALSVDLVRKSQRTRAVIKPGLGQRLGLGKYREILFAVALFLLFDLAVLVLNFYVSYQISEDAVAINLSGRQRMLTQRIAKNIFGLEAAQARNLPTDELLKDLQQAVNLFDRSLEAFRSGGQVPGGNGKPAFLPAVRGAAGIALLTQASQRWEAWRSSLEPVLQGGDRASALVETAARAAREHNLPLLGLMNGLTTELENDAGARASWLRRVQTAGIALALLNFLFILFKFIRRLQRSDAAAEAATEENREILSSVREGLFLLTRELRLGSQISASVATMFGRKVVAGESFMAMLKPLVSASVAKDAQDYLELLFQPHIEESLVRSINPLTEVELSIVDSFGMDKSCFLAFSFNRASVDGEIKHLLVTVQDIGDRMLLARQLAGEQQRAQREFELLVKAFEADPASLRGFVERAEAALLDVNSMLSQVGSSTDARQLQRTIQAVYRHVHAVKGDAALLGLDLLAATAHDFESQLQTLRESPDARGDALLSLPLPLEELLTRLQSLKRWVLRAPALVASGNAFGEQLAALAARVGKDTGKQAVLAHDIAALSSLPAAQQSALTQIATQLVRNAMVHGIEPPTDRLARNKPAAGSISVNLASRDDGSLDLAVRDDGAGLDARRVRERLLELGWFSGEQLDEMSPQQVMSQIFKPGFSTAAQAGVHGGRGIGLDVVMAHVRQIGGQLLVSSRIGQGTEFRIRLAA